MLCFEACEQSAATAFLYKTTTTGWLIASTAALFRVQFAEQSTAMVSCFSGFACYYCRTD
ncbi:hypothetical protein [Novipirellula galeiformis]|uniref:hypothetical protein n=1 Tax=Novipirellula galeiformis TaxID=2528004 RepID=UPI0011B8094E|nr:hypothetical protein [Novipirellula galeiformis]